MGLITLHFPLSAYRQDAWDFELSQGQTTVREIQGSKRALGHFPSGREETSEGFVLIPPLNACANVIPV